MTALDLDAVEREIDKLGQWADRNLPRTDYALHVTAWKVGSLIPAARLVHQQARECAACGGTGEYAYRTIDGTLRLRRCFVCAPARAALAAIVGEQ